MRDVSMILLLILSWIRICEAQPVLHEDWSSIAPPPLGNFSDVLRYLDTSYQPSWLNGVPVTVKLGIYIESLSSIKATEMVCAEIQLHYMQRFFAIGTMAFDVDMYLRQSWSDSRLRHGMKRHYSITDMNLASNVWKPDLFIANAKHAYFQKVTRHNYMLFIYPNGEVHYSVRILATVACNLNLRSYPFDSQTCSIKLTSYAHPTTELLLSWFHLKPVQYNKAIDLPEMNIVGMYPERCDYKNYTYGETETVILQGDFGCLSGTILLKRAIGYHLVQTYIPTFLIVVVSWLSFWIDPSAVPARVSLSFTTLLTLATMAAGLRMALPPVAYAKAIDYWVGTCTLFVFGALLEFALVNTFVRRATSKKTKLFETAQKYALMMPFAGPQPAKDDTACNGASNRNDKKKHEEMLANSDLWSKTPLKIDMISRILFPLGFFVFNVLYWTIYLQR